MRDTILQIGRKKEDSLLSSGIESLNKEANERTKLYLRARTMRVRQSLRHDVAYLDCHHLSFMNKKASFL